MLEAVHIDRPLHAALQAIDLLTQLAVQLACSRTVVGMTGTGFMKVALESFQTLIELLQVSLEFVLPAVGDRQHEHGQVIEHRDQLIPVQPPCHALAHFQSLGFVAFRQAKVIEQADQGLLDMRGNLAVGRLDCVRE
ncbi:hypothetical protein D3C81_1178530 [compost metagenome]